MHVSAEAELEENELPLSGDGCVRHPSMPGKLISKSWTLLQKALFFHALSSSFVLCKVHHKHTCRSVGDAPPMDDGKDMAACSVEPNSIITRIPGLMSCRTTDCPATAYRARQHLGPEISCLSRDKERPTVPLTERPRIKHSLALTELNYRMWYVNKGRAPTGPFSTLGL